MISGAYTLYRLKTLKYEAPSHNEVGWEETSCGVQSMKLRMNFNFSISYSQIKSMLFLTDPLVWGRFFLLRLQDVDSTELHPGRGLAFSAARFFRLKTS